MRKQMSCKIHIRKKIEVKKTTIKQQARRDSHGNVLKILIECTLQCMYLRTLTSAVTMKKFSSLSLLYGVSMLRVRQRIFPLIVRDKSAEHSLFDSNLSNNIPANSLMSFCSTVLIGEPS